MEQTILEVCRLTACFQTEKGVILPVNDVSLSVPEGKIVGIVGESGCGKSMTARAIMGLLRFPGKVTGGKILLCGREITSLPEKERRRLRGSENPPAARRSAQPGQSALRLPLPYPVPLRSGTLRRGGTGPSGDRRRTNGLSLRGRIERFMIQRYRISRGKTLC